MRTVGGIEFDIERIISDFNSRVDYAKAGQIALHKIPNKTRSLLENASRRFMNPEDLEGREYIFPIRTDYLCGDHGFGLLYPTRYSCGDSEISMYFFEYNTKEEMTGHGEIRFNYSNPSSYFRNKPFVGYITTEDKFQRKGLGLRMHRMMNDLSKSLFGLILHSDTNMTFPEHELWKKLVLIGEADHYLENGRTDRYKFLR